MSCTALSDAPSRSIKLATLFVTLVTTWVFSGQVLAATSTVCDSGCDYTSIEIAVDNASDGDTLDIQSTITESGIFVHRPLTILSSLPTPQIVQAHALPETASDRVFFISAPGEVVIENLTIRHGVAPGNGFGGGIYTDTELTLVGVQVENNFAGSGGGMVVQSATNSSVVTIRQSTFRANRSSSSGGAVHCDAGAIVDVKDSTFAHNSSFEGGAFRATSSCTLSVENSTISMNRANNGGGGIFNRGNTTVTDSTFSRNSLRAIQSNEGSFVITNSILADSLTTPFGEGGPDCDVFSGATITDGGYNLVENTGGCGSFFTATGTVTGVDPELNVLAKYGGPTMTHYFLQSSPVYNTGSTSGSFDQRGFARGIFGADDKGAVELQVEEIFIPSVFLAQAIHVGVSYNIEFEWFSNRSPNFDVQIQQSGGSYLPFSPFYFHHRTYIGKVDGAPGATAAAMFFPFTGELVYNVIFEDGSEWNHVNGATTERSIALPDNWPQWSARTGGAGSKIWAAEVGVDMPFNDYIEIHGSDPDEAIAWIEYSIMKANLLYLQQVGVKHELGRVILRSNVGSDPYNGINNHIDNLAQIETQWETELPLTFPNSTHDIALVTGVRDGGGLASTGSIGSPGYSSNSPAITVPATTISRGDFSGVWRHEAGHNWGLRHFVSDATNNSTMMGGNYARIWGPSQDTVLSYRDSIVGELDDLGSASAAIPPRASLDAAFIDASQATTLIDVLANDHDANGEALTLVSVDSTSALGLGGTMALAVGEGGIGQDVVRYTAPAVGGPTSAIDRFTYRIRDASGQEATGYVFVRMVEFGDASTYVQNFDGFADGTTVIGDGSYLSTANNEPTYLPLSVTNGVLTLMPEQGGRRTSYTLPLRNLTDGFVAQFTYNISSSGGIPADGFAFNFGDPSPRVAPDLVGSNGGFRRGMTIDFDTYNDNQGYNVSVDNVTVAYVPDALIPDGFDHNAVVSWNPTNGLTLKIDGWTVFDGLDLSAEFTPTADDMLAFAARTGGLDQQVLLDNVVVSPAVVVPLNDDFDDAIDISLGSSTVGTLVNATTDGSVTLTTLYTGDVWYTYTAASTGNLFLNTCSSQLTYGVDTVLSVHSNTGVPGTIDNQLTANDDYESGDDPAVCDVSGSLLDSAVVLSVTAGTTYLIRVSLYNVPEGQFVLNWSFEEPVVDTDGDGVFDNTDNCTLVANSDQRDTNGDGYGNICDPDLNNDGIVNFLDFSAWRPLFNTTCGDVDADLNGDGLCNFGDYAIFPGFFQQPPGPSGVAP